MSASEPEAPAASPVGGSVDARLCRRRRQARGLTPILARVLLPSVLTVLVPCVPGNLRLGERRDVPAGDDAPMSYLALSDP